MSARERAWHAPQMLLCVAVLGWSGNFVLGRLVGDTMPPVALAFARWTLALGILLPLGWRTLRDDLPALRAQGPLVLALAISGITVFNTFVYIGLRSTPAVTGALLQSVTPLLIVVFAALLYREHPSRYQILGLACSLLGVWVVVTGGDLLRGRLSVGTGELWILAAVVSYALYTTLLRRRPAVRAISLLIATFGLGLAFLTPFAVLEFVAGHRAPLTAESGLAVLYVGIVPSIVSYFCWNRGVELLGPSRAGQYIHLMPVFSAAIAFLVLGEGLQPFHLVGAAAIAAGLFLAGRPVVSTPRPAP